jgi:hypothetical protein
MRGGVYDRMSLLLFASIFLLWFPSVADGDHGSAGMADSSAFSGEGQELFFEVLAFLGDQLSKGDAQNANRLLLLALRLDTQAACGSFAFLGGWTGGSPIRPNVQRRLKAGLEQMLSHLDEQKRKEQNAPEGGRRLPLLYLLAAKLCQAGNVKSSLLWTRMIAQCSEGNKSPQHALPSAIFQSAVPALMDTDGNRAAFAAMRTLYELMRGQSMSSRVDYGGANGLQEQAWLIAQARVLLLIHRYREASDVLLKALQVCMLFPSRYWVDFVCFLSCMFVVILMCACVLELLLA